ncbi:MAG: TolC family protein [Saprospiraceae bacterium]
MKRLYLIIFALVMFAQTYAQQGFSLEQAVNYGQSNNPSVKIAQIGITDAEQQIIETRAIGLPTVRAGVNYQHFLQIPGSLVPAEFFGGQPGEFAEVQFGVKNNLAASLEVQSLLFDASYFTGLEAAKNYRTFASQQVEVAKQDIKRNVTMAYLATLIYDETATVIDSNRKNLERIIFETTELYKEGFAEQLDIDRLTLSLKQLTTQTESLERQKEIAMNNLKFVMGFPLEQDLEITETLEGLVESGFSAEVNEKLVLDNHATYQMLKTGIALSEMNVTAQKQQGYYPNLAAFGTYQQSLQGDNLFGDAAVWIPTAVVGLQLNIPIFDGFARGAKVQRAELDVEESVRQRDQYAESVELEVENARIKYRDAVAKVTNVKENQALAERIYNTIQIKYKEGLASSFELNQAENALFVEQSSYIQALFELLMAKAELEIALGK